VKPIIKIFPTIFFCLFSLKSFAGATYAGERLDLSPRNAFPTGIAWNNDRSKLFITGIGSGQHNTNLSLLSKF
jgi:hypothetical protein